MSYAEVYDYLRALLRIHGVSLTGYEEIFREYDEILRKLLGSILESDYPSFQHNLTLLLSLIKHLGISPVREIEIIEQIVRFLRIARKQKDISSGFYFRARRFVENLLKKREYIVKGIEEKVKAIEEVNKKKLNEGDVETPVAPS